MNINKKYYKTIFGNLLEADTKYIAHQCNCVTAYAAHLSKDVFEKFPWADIYTPRMECGYFDVPLEGEEPGNIVICGNGQNKRFVINILGQYFPGNAKYPNDKKDGYKARMRYFVSALNKISKIDDLESIAFPYKIGCGAAGGNWSYYEKFINIFAKNIKENVFIYKLN